MAFTPISKTWGYKKYNPNPLIPLNVIFTDATITAFPSRNYQVIGVPNWLTVKDIIFNNANKQIEFLAEINTSVAQNLNHGNYTVNLSAKFQWQSIFGWENRTVGGLSITLTVTNTILLTLNPTTLPFGNYLIGNPFPQNKTLQIQSESNWNISASQSFVTLSLTSGVGNGQVFIGVDPTGLTPGNYDAIITVNDNFFTRTAVVTLTVTEGDNETDYLYITPRNFEFVSEMEVANTKELPINVDVSDAWTATPSAAWIVISSASGIEGIHDLTISVDSDELAVGTYQGTIEFVSGDITKKVYITLKVIEFLVSGLESYGLYFSDDRNSLQVTSTADNTFLLLDTVAANGVDNLPYEQEAPYLQEKAEIIIGQETNNLSVSPAANTLFTSRIQNRIKPVIIGFTAYNINKLNDAVTQIAQLQNLIFLKGKTPAVANKLCYIPNAITVTNKAILSLTVLETEEAPTEIVISGDIEATISTGIANDLLVYNAIVNLNELGLVKGNTIVITFGSLVINVTIKGNEPEETLIAFENEWGEDEFFNCTGFLTKTPSISDTTTQLAVNGKELTKVVSIDYGEEFSLNTGFIYSQEEVDWLATILKAKRKFVYLNGEPIEVILTTKKLETYETRQYAQSFKLQFKRALV